MENVFINMKNITLILIGMYIGIFTGLLRHAIIPNRMDMTTLQETVRAAVVLNAFFLLQLTFHLV